MIFSHALARRRTDVLDRAPHGARREHGPAHQRQHAHGADSPREVPAPWRAMVQILGLDGHFNDRYGSADERHVVRFLMADTGNPSSIVSALAQARENARTTREILPSEAWEQINDVYLHAREQAARSLARNLREPFLIGI